jgi:hypothetical protein
MPRVHVYHVTPSLPTRLSCLDKLSLNLRWSWHHPTIELFRALDPDLWEDTGHNPRLILGRIDQKRLASRYTSQKLADGLRPAPGVSRGAVCWRGSGVTWSLELAGFAGSESVAGGSLTAFGDSESEVTAAGGLALLERTRPRGGRGSIPASFK